MKFFIDTAEFSEIKDAYSYGFIDGVTTNPSLIVKAKRDLKQVIKEIADLVEGPVSAEVIASDAPGMIEEAHELVKLGSNVVVKIPMTPEGLKAVAVLSKEGIKTNVTLIFSANQALLIQDIADIFAIHGINTEIIAASVRTPLHILQCAKAGAHIATVPYKVLLQAMKHPLTDAGLEKFMADWKQANQ